jgi:hypothetical protein
MRPVFTSGSRSRFGHAAREDQLDENLSVRGGRKISPFGRPTFVLAAPSLVLAFAVVWILSQVNRVGDRRASSHEQRGPAWPQTSWKNARLDVKYVGDSACARCHAEIAETFRHHPMGRSLAPIAGGEDRPDSTTTVEAGSFRYTVERRGGHVVHREAQLDQEGRVLAQVEADVKYALGSGERGTSYLVERDGRLFESPISWYSQKKRWDLSPGYKQSNLHFDRPIVPHCLFCHTNRVEPIEHTINGYEQPIFRGDAIGCERCHGPGELHARRPEWVDGRDVTIVNPRHLEPALGLAVCEQCHLLGDHRVDRLDRDTFDYRPGLSLTEFFAVFGRADQHEARAVGQVEQMKESRCFRASEGRLGCTSCHDPHQVPSPQEKIAYFRQQCLACHEQKGCKLPDPVRLAESPLDSCIQCHMRRFKTTDIIHTATTDHRILRTPLPEGPETEHSARGLPLVLLSGENLTEAELKSLDRELAIAVATEGPRLRDSPQIREAGALVLATLDRALAKRHDDMRARRMKAQALALSGRRAQALGVIRSALTLVPEDEYALEQYLSYAVDEKDIDAAIEPARRAVAANPWSSVFHERLAYFLLELKDYAGSLLQAREALRLNPFLRFARMFAIQSLLKQHEFDRAQAEFATLVKMFENQRQSLETWFAEQRRD